MTENKNLNQKLNSTEAREGLSQGEETWNKGRDKCRGASKGDDKVVGVIRMESLIR